MRNFYSERQIWVLREAPPSRRLRKRSSQTVLHKIPKTTWPNLICTSLKLTHKSHDMSGSTNQIKWLLHTWESKEMFLWHDWRLKPSNYWPQGAEHLSQSEDVPKHQSHWVIADLSASTPDQLSVITWFYLGMGVEPHRLMILLNSFPWRAEDWSLADCLIWLWLKDARYQLWHHCLNLVSIKTLSNKTNIFPFLYKYNSSLK